MCGCRRGGRVGMFDVSDECEEMGWGDWVDGLVGA